MEEVALEDRTPIQDYADVCPVHGGKEREQCDFGNPADPAASVMVFDGCFCAVCWVPWPVGVYYFFNHWNQASDLAQAQIFKETK